MHYEDFKKVVQDGDLVFVSHQEWKTLADWESQLVRMATESEFSHVAVAMVHEGEPVVLEAVVPCVTISSLEKYLDNGFFHLATPDKPMTGAEREYGMSKIGQRYSKVEAVEGYLDLITIGASDSWYCAELTIAMRRFSGLDTGPRATPAAVARKALQLGYTMNFITKDTDD